MVRNLTQFDFNCLRHAATYGRKNHVTKLKRLPNIVYQTQNSEIKNNEVTAYIQMNCHDGVFQLSTDCIQFIDCKISSK